MNTQIENAANEIETIEGAAVETAAVETATETATETQGEHPPLRWRVRGDEDGLSLAGRQLGQEPDRQEIPEGHHAMAHDAQLTRLVADLKRQLEIANSQALHFKPAEDRRIGMPSVWELQNGHLKDQIDRIEERLAELGLVAR